MANSVTSERLWSLTDASATAIKAVGTEVIVRKLIYVPGAVDDDVVVQEYDSAGSVRSAIVLKANHTDVNPIAVDFGRMGRRLNGFVLSTIDGGTVYVYLGSD